MDAPRGGGVASLWRWSACRVAGQRGGCERAGGGLLSWKWLVDRRDGRGGVVVHLLLCGEQAGLGGSELQPRVAVGVAGRLRREPERGGEVPAGLPPPRGDVGLADAEPGLDEANQRRVIEHVGLVQRSLMWQWEQGQQTCAATGARRRGPGRRGRSRAPTRGPGELRPHRGAGARPAAGAGPAACALPGGSSAEVALAEPGGANSTIRPLPLSATHAWPLAVMARSWGNARSSLAWPTLACSPNSVWKLPSGLNTVTHP